MILKKIEHNAPNRNNIESSLFSASRCSTNFNKQITGSSGGCYSGFLHQKVPHQ